MQIQKFLRFLSIFQKKYNENSNTECVKKVRIRSFSGPYFPASGPKNSEYGQHLRNDTIKAFLKTFENGVKSFYFFSEVTLSNI